MRTVRCNGRQEVSVPVHAGIHLPWTEFLTHACENITFPQLRCGRLKTCPVRDMTAWNY